MFVNPHVITALEFFHSARRASVSRGLRFSGSCSKTAALKANLAFRGVCGRGGCVGFQGALNPRP